MKQGYGYNDISIIPASISYIRTRKSVNVYDINKKLPIFTAPMSTVINEDNFDYFDKCGVYPIIPRNISFEIRKEYMRSKKWVAVSLNEFESFLESEKTLEGFNICIDIANGHMNHLYTLCSKVYNYFQEDYNLMVGNIANPDTIYDISTVYGITNIKYLRLSIGSGSGCITSSNTGIHYPIASLIQECKIARDKVCQDIILIADGGIKNYSDVIKALALGADYVMIGGLFASLLESAADICTGSTSIKVSDICNLGESQKFDIIKQSIKKDFYGMASKQGQKDLGTKGTAEGIHKTLEVSYTLKQWINNMEDYLKSAMSYCGAFTLSEFIGIPEIIINSYNEQISINK